PSCRGAPMTRLVREARRLLSVSINQSSVGSRRSTSPILRDWVHTRQLVGKEPRETRRYRRQRDATAKLRNGVPLTDGAGGCAVRAWLSAVSVGPGVAMSHGRTLRSRPANSSAPCSRCRTGAIPPTRLAVPPAGIIGYIGYTVIVVVFNVLEITKGCDDIAVIE